MSQNNGLMATEIRIGLKAACGLVSGYWLKGKDALAKKPRRTLQRPPFSRYQKAVLHSDHNDGRPVDALFDRNWCRADLNSACSGALQTP